jgi:hypothetical protein
MRFLRTFVLALVAVSIPALTLADAWQTYSTPTDGFSIDVPAAFALQVLPDADAPDNVMHIYSVSDRSDPAGTAFYLVGAAQTKAPLAQLADADFRGYAGSVKCTLSASKPRTIDGYAALEATCAGGNVAMSLIDEVEANGYSYMLASGGPAGHDTSAAALRYRDSLVLLPPAVASPAPSPTV